MTVDGPRVGEYRSRESRGRFVPSPPGSARDAADAAGEAAQGRREHGRSAAVDPDPPDPVAGVLLDARTHGFLQRMARVEVVGRRPPVHRARKQE